MLEQIGPHDFAVVASVLCVACRICARGTAEPNNRNRRRRYRNGCDRKPACMVHPNFSHRLLLLLLL